MREFYFYLILPRVQIQKLYLYIFWWAGQKNLLRDKGVQSICTCGIVKRTSLNGIYELSTKWNLCYKMIYLLNFKQKVEWEWTGSTKSTMKALMRFWFKVHIYIDHYRFYNEIESKYPLFLFFVFIYANKFWNINKNGYKQKTIKIIKSKL